MLFGNHNIKLHATVRLMSVASDGLYISTFNNNQLDEQPFPQWDDIDGKIIKGDGLLLFVCYQNSFFQWFVGIELSQGIRFTFTGIGICNRIGYLYGCPLRWYIKIDFDVILLLFIITK